MKWRSKVDVVHHQIVFGGLVEMTLLDHGAGGGGGKNNSHFDYVI